MKRAAFVLSDFTYPVQEGLHEQSLLSVQRLQQLGYEVDVYLIVKKLARVDLVLLKYQVGLVPILCLQVGNLPLVIHALLSIFSRINPFSKLAPLRKKLISEDYNLIHLDGVLASALSPVKIRKNSIISLVDPGSRRYQRFAQLANGFSDTFRFLLVSALYKTLEQSLTIGRGTWHVVSKPDREYLQHRYPQMSIVDIPVALPGPVTRPEAEVSCADSSNIVQVLIYCDLRQNHMVRALEALADGIFAKSHHVRSTEITVLGRSLPNNDLLDKYADYNVTFYDSIDHYMTVLAQSDIIILPDVVGTGLKNRAVQSLAMGKAVLATSVALEGIETSPGTDCIVLEWNRAGDDLDRLISDAALRSSLGISARKTIGRFTEENVRELWRLVYNAVAISRNPTEQGVESPDMHR